MMGPIRMDKVLEMQRQRGPRWLVYASIRAGEHVATFAVSAEQAEKILQRYLDNGYYTALVTPPEGSIRLGQLGREAKAAKDAAKDAEDAAKAAEQKLLAGVLRAHREQRAIEEIARQAHLSEETVSRWVGGPNREDQATDGSGGG